jgi:SAM-dependent methyltransferase
MGENLLVSFHYLAHLAELGTADIHPLGARATQALIDALDVRAGQRVLEIGCGTGNTAILIASSADVDAVGIDILPEMLAAARKRVLWAGGIDRVHLLQASGYSLPFGSRSFDRVYAESVLGFQDRDQAERMLAEVFRALKPGGLFVANEAIWKEGVSQAAVDGILDRSLDDFGLGQASPQSWHLTDWLKLMGQVGFDVLSSPSLDAITAASKSSLLNQTWKHRLLRLRLALFSSFYRLRRYWRPRLRRASQIYEDRLRKHSRDGGYIEARLFVLEKGAEG